MDSNEIEITIKEAAAVDSKLKGTWLESNYPNPNSFVIDGEKVVMTFGNGDTAELPFTDIDENNYAVFGEYTDKNTAGYFKAKVSSSYSNVVDYVYNVTINETNHKANVSTQTSTLAKKAEKVTLKSSYSEIKVGGKTTLYATFGPENCYGESWEVESSDASIVSISDNDGIVTATGVGAGTATLTLTSEFGLTDSIEITVTEPQKVTGITVTLSSDSVTKGSTVTATAAVAPTNADNKNVVWSTSDSEIATINSRGVITTLAAGTVDIIATAADGSGVTGKATLTITEATASFDGVYTATDTTGYGSSLTITISNSGESCSIYAEDQSGGTLTGTISKKSSSGNMYVYEGRLDDAYGSIDEATITIDFGEKTVTIESEYEGYMYDGCQFINARITKVS